MIQDKIINIFKSKESIEKFKLISSLNPLTFSKHTIYKKEYIYFTKQYTQQLLDPPKINEETTRIYHQTYLKIDSLLFESTNISSGIITINNKNIGREYSKTPQLKITQNEKPNKILFQVLKGNGFFILESLNKQITKIIKIKQQNLILIPKNYTFTIINSNKKKDLNCIYLTLNDTKFSTNKNNFGTSIFYTNNGFIKNKNSSPSFELEDITGDYIPNLKFEKEKSLYVQFIELPEKFNFLKE